MLSDCEWITNCFVVIVVAVFMRICIASIYTAQKFPTGLPVAGCFLFLAGFNFLWNSSANKGNYMSFFLDYGDVMMMLCINLNQH